MKQLLFKWALHTHRAVSCLLKDIDVSPFHKHPNDTSKFEGCRFPCSNWRGKSAYPVKKSAFDCTRFPFTRILKSIPGWLKVMYGIPYFFFLIHNKWSCNYTISVQEYLNMEFWYKLFAKTPEIQSNLSQWSIQLSRHLPLKVNILWAQTFILIVIWPVSSRQLPSKVIFTLFLDCLLKTCLTVTDFETSLPKTSTGLINSGFFQSCFSLIADVFNITLLLSLQVQNN